MPLRKGESFLAASARAKAAKGGARLSRAFLPPALLPPPPKIPPIPKAVKEWEKKTPAAKLKAAGFLGAVQNDRLATRFRYEREAARMAPVLAHVPTVRPITDPVTISRQRYRSELDRLQHLPKSKRPKDYEGRVLRAKMGADVSIDPVGDIAEGIWQGTKPLRSYLTGRALQPSKHVQYGGIPLPRVFEDVAETTAKMAAGLPVGLAGAVRHPLRVPNQVSAIVSDMVQPIGLAMASTNSASARQKMWREFVQDSLRSVEEQYGPEASWGESVRQSYDQGIIAALQGLAVVAPVAKGLSIAKAVSPGFRVAGEGVEATSGVGLREAIRRSGKPAEPRLIGLRGGEEAMARPVEINWSRSPLIRGTVQRPYDVISRRISEETPVVGKLSEASRAARVTRRNLKRDVRRAQAEAANVLHGLGRENDAANLRAVYMRGKPEGVDEDTWLQAQLDDVNEMLGGRGMIPRGRESPKLKQLRRRVAVLQRKFDRTQTDVEQRTIARKLEGLSGEQLAVARGEPVGPVPDSPARAQMAAVFDEALGSEQGAVAMQVADQFARGAEPDNPSAWFDRVLTQYAQDPEASGVDLANALLQEAGPRGSLAGRVGLTHTQVQEALNRSSPVTVVNDAGEPLMTGEISFMDGGAGRATVLDRATGQEVTVPYARLKQGEADDAPVFYSQAQKVVAEKFPPKVNPDQLIALLEKNQVKKAELEWTGLLDWAEALKDSGVKSVSREEVIDYLANPLNAYDLQETLWEEGAHPHGTRWDPDNYSGVTLQDIPGDYKELMVQLPGDQVYQSSGHMPGISNPLVQLRFHEVNQRGYNEILIDEMQSDWAAAARDVDYETKGPDSQARLDEIRQEVGKLTVETIERILGALDLPYTEIPGGTTDIRGVGMYLEELRRKLDADWSRANGVTYAKTPEQADAFAEWMATPERALVERLHKHYSAVARRIQRLGAQERKIVNAPADMPYKKTWELLGLKRMVAYAVHNGFDAISWPQGIVPAVRYQKVDVEVEHDYGDPTEHPEYPDEDNYTRGYTFHETSFSVSGFANDPLQERLFGDIVGWQPNWKQENWGPREPVPMSTTRPVVMTAKELGREADETLVADDLIYLEEGPFPDQFVRIARANEDGTYDVAPSGIESVEIRGDSDHDGAWTNYEATVVDAQGHHYGSGSSASDALRSANFDDVADSEWFDDVETSLDRGWEHELDDYAYQEAVNDFMERWNDGEIENSPLNSALLPAEEIAQLDYSHYKGNAYRYDTIFPSAARKEWKKYGVDVEKSSVEGRFTVEGTGPVSETGAIPTWRMEIPEALANDVRQGQSFFQAVYPLSGSTTPVVKGAVELMGNRRFRMTLFGQADISTALHELGHIALYDLDPNDLGTIERELGGGRALSDWTRHDHERFARAWERYFREGYASATSLRNVFDRIKQWMSAVYNGYKASGDPLSPEVRRVFDKRLGRVGIDEADRLPIDPALQRWGVLLSQAKTELEAYEARAEIARQKGTDEALRAEMEDLTGKRNKAQQAGDQERFDELTTEIRSIVKELDDRDALNAMRVDRRRKLLTVRADELRKALQKPDSRRYEGAQAAADFFQDERENILRDVFGDKYDDIFAGRRQQMSAWLAARGHLPESAVGEGQGFLPFRRRGGVGATIRQAASPVTRRFGRSRTNELNLHSRNQMVLWQQGDYQASIDVLHEQYMRALSFKYQHDLRSLLHQIGEPVDVSGPKEGWYLVDPDGTPLPREWKGESAEEIDAEVQAVLDGLSADDAQLGLQLQHFAENWLHTDPSRARRPDGGYGNVRQVHPRIVNQLMLPYTGNQLWNPVVRAAQIPNTLARMSLIYTAPGYIPSNILANAIMLFAERGVFGLKDMAAGARLVMKDRTLGRLVRAEMGETFTTSKLRADTGEVLAMPRRLEGKLASAVSFVADDWMRAATWSGIAHRNGYKTRDAQLRLLQGRTEQTRRDRNRIGDQAVKSMIDFDRLSPWEQRWLRPIVFVWPFMRGATAWPIDYVMAHPFRAGAAVALTHGYGEQAREELGPTPAYYSSLVPTDLAQQEVMNLQSVNPIGAFGDIAQVAGGNITSLVSAEDVPTFRDLSGFLAPQVDLTLQIIRGRGQFGEAKSLQEIVKEAGPDYIPFLSLYLDALDETKPAVQLDQGLGATLARKTFRFAPQRMNLALLNQQAKERGEAKTPTQKMAEERVAARAAWNQLLPGDHMPRAIEDSIKAYYTVQANRKLLQNEIKTQQRESWQPTRREPKLTELQEAAIVFDVLAAQQPGMVEGAPDPREVYEQYGEEGIKRYRQNIERALFMGKRRADEARRKAKQMRKAGVR